MFLSWGVLLRYVSIVYAGYSMIIKYFSCFLLFLVGNSGARGLLTLLVC